MPAQFYIHEADPAATEVLRKTLGLPRFIAATLVARGISSPQEAGEFLRPSLARDWGNPYCIPGMDEVVGGLEAAVRSGKRIMVFGDFDLDGISSTAVLTRGLRELGGEVVPFIPRRPDEGYGITEAAIERLMKDEPDLLVTVDCGIACRNEVRLLKNRGVDVFITDHHEPADLVPEEVPVCDPKIDPDCSESILAGVGVALKLIQALGARFGQPHLWREYTDLATLGTIADLMPMQQDNRALVADGIAHMNESPRPCIAALLHSAGVADKPVSSTSLSFSVIPRLNAAGRMGDAMLALNLLLEDDTNLAQDIAADLEAVNSQRRAIEAELAEIATLQAQEIYQGQRALIVAGEGWHEGVKGIVASRLARSYGVPTILFAIDEEGIARGSGRSVGSVNLFKAVESCSDMLIRFGGHEAAVGVTLPAADLPVFTKRLCAFMDGLDKNCFHPRIDIDACVNLDELTVENVEALEQLAPFGQGNRQPTYLAQNVMLTRSRAVGVDKNHFSTVLTDGAHTVSGIMFHCAYIDRLMHCDSVVNAGFEVQVDEWRGRRSVKAMLSSIYPAQPCVALESMLDPEQKSFVSELYAASDAELVADCEDTPEEVTRLDAEREQNRQHWEQVAAQDPQSLREAVVQALIGDGALFNSQKQILSALDNNIDTLAVMATGRGKSLTFQVHAATRALASGQASLFVYPLRALIADQAYHLNHALLPFGLNAEVLTGESAPEERQRIFEGLVQGTVDIVLTTPEFLTIHANRLAQSGRIGFLVVDEAHHIGQARAGNRMAYAHIDRAIARLGNPCVLALTATADAQCAQAIEETLGCHHRVLDRTERKNLVLDDQRNLKQSDPYLANLVSQGAKMVIYVNSRRHSVALARSLRKRVPQMAPFIGFYNAGLARPDRCRVEELFRTGQLTVLVSTSAFGEGVNIPDIRHVVLYHMPFNEIEFNQMSGRAGRDGKEAVVHLLFSATDARINEGILADATPNHDTLAQVYRELKRLSAEADGSPLRVSDADLAQICSDRQPALRMSQDSVACAIAVFRELGLVETEVSATQGEHRLIRLIEAHGNKAELTDSVRYREGLDEIEIFRTFCHWVGSATAPVLQSRIIRPILPDESQEEV